MKRIIKFSDFNIVNENISHEDISAMKLFVEKNSYFIFDMKDDFDILFSTREHGSTGNGTHGIKDYREGIRLKKLLLNRFPNVSVIVETVDEFVIIRVTLTDKEKSYKESKDYYQRLVNLTGSEKTVDDFINIIKYQIQNDHSSMSPKNYINHFSKQADFLNIFLEYKLEDYKEKIINIIVAYRIGLISDYDFSHSNESSTYNAIINLNNTVLELVKDDVELCNISIYNDYEHTDKHHNIIKFGNSKIDNEKSYTYFTTDKKNNFTSKELLYKTLSDIKRMVNNLHTFDDNNVQLYYNDWLDMLNRNK